MNKGLIILLILLTSSPVFASQQAIYCLVDAASLDVLIHDTLISRIEVGVNIDQQFSFRIPFNMTMEMESGGSSFLETGIFLDYHPLKNGLHISISLIQIGVLVNDWYEDNEGPYKFLNEVVFGWSFNPVSNLIIQPRLIICDPNGIHTDEYEALSLRFSRFPLIRFSLMVGWSFPIDDQKTEESEQEE